MQKKRKPAKKKAKARRRKPAQPKPQPQSLPAPLDVQVDQLPEAEAQPSLMEKVSSLFKKTEPEIQSEISSESTSGDSLPPESQALLDSVPDVVGSDPGETGAGGELPAAIDDNQDPIASLMVQVAFEEQDVKDQLCEFFEWLGEKFESDHWKLSDRQARMLGRPAAQVANATWEKLRVIIPGIIGNWCESTPGATALIMAGGIVVGPKITKQMAINRARKATKSKTDSMLHSRHEQPRATGPQPVQPKGGLIWQQAPPE